MANHTTEELWEMRKRAHELMEETQRHLNSDEPLSEKALDDLTYCLKQLNKLISWINKDLGLEST